MTAPAARCWFGDSGGGEPMSAPTFTERQAKALEEDVKPVLARHGIADLPNWWNLHWFEEVRPGRGHFLNATYFDGEHFAQVLMDVYGYPNISVAQLDWVHADSDEEMECETCAPARPAPTDREGEA